MKIDSSIIKYQQNSSITPKAESALDQNNPAVSTTSSANSESSTVAISGKSLVLSRLFGNAAPTKPSGDLLSMENRQLRPVNFLTEKDKDLLAKMYEFAQQQGADLRHVDTIGIELGSYRQNDDLRFVSDFNNGQNFDLEGHQLTVSFNAEDTKTAARILSGDSIKSTQLDQGFLTKMLNATSGALVGIGDLHFLEQMVTKFSDKGANATLDSKFSTFNPTSAVNKNAVYTKSKEIVNPVIQPQIINDNGRWIYPDQQNLLTNIQSALGKAAQNSANFNDQILNAILDNDSKTNEKSKSLLNDLIAKNRLKDS